MDSAIRNPKSAIRCVYHLDYFSNMKNRISSHPDAAFQKKFIAHLDALIEMSAELIIGTNADDMKNGLDMCASIAFMKTDRNALSLLKK
jgi:hypothetical protein